LTELFNCCFQRRSDKISILSPIALPCIKYSHYHHHTPARSCRTSFVPKKRRPRVTQSSSARSAAPRGAAAGVAFEARAVANRRQVAAFAAGLAFVALGLGLGALLRRQRPRIHARVGKLAARQSELLLLELLGGRELLLGLGLERGGAFRARLAAAEGGDLAAARRATRATLPPADGGG